jgi:hypothetical protein
VTDAALELPDCGFAVLRNVAGRNNDFIVARSGCRVHTAAIGCVMRGCEAIECYRVHQHADGSLSVTVQLRGPTASLDGERFRQTIVKIVEGWPVELKIVDAMPRSLTGKHRWVVSDFPVREETSDAEVQLPGGSLVGNER